MTKISLLLTVAITLGLSAAIMAQNVPSYVPNNGLLGWWPFNGNANDESGNGNNGTVNGATLTTDRYGNTNRSYQFYNLSGGGGFIELSGITLGNVFTISTWVKLDAFTPGNVSSVISKYSGVNGYELNIDHNNLNPGARGIFGLLGPESIPANSVNSNYPFGPNSWGHIVWVKNEANSYFYLNDSLIYQQTNVNSTTTNNGNTYFGKAQWGGNQFRGRIDDIGFWNRALTLQEITNLFNGCQQSLNTQPISQQTNINNTAEFIVGSSNPNSTFQWQTDLGVGFQNLNNVGQYSGTSNDTLIVSNVLMSNNNQPFRCIVSSGSCSDTSNEAVLTVNNNVGINKFSLDELLTIYPNPTQTVINVKVDSKLVGEPYSVIDNTGRTVLSGQITGDILSIELHSLSNGTYLFRIKDEFNLSFQIIN
ncbi:MAG: hypothetical protein RL365_2233 [Bacteroidota bacterium]|jgi:hypothetical protein